MGFLKKVKNMFTEEIEDEDEVKVEKVKNDVKKIKIGPSDEEISSFDRDFEFNDEEKIENDKPVFFDETAFNDLEIEEKFEKKEKIEDYKKLEEVHGVRKDYELAEKYNNYAKEEKKEVVTEPLKKAFKPTPIISPVYGVLDKNYHKEDIVSKSETKVDSDYIVEPSIDSIRNKAYGTLEDELENTLFGKNSSLYGSSNDEVIESNSDENSSESLQEISSDKISNLTEDIGKELDDLLLEKEKVMSRDKSKKERNIKSKRNKSEEDDDLLEFIDSTLYKEGEE